jgi:hypothetical protein
VLDSITPVIITLNEGPNLARLLAAVDWAKDVVIVDSGSTDETLAIASADPRVRLFTRKFDTLWDQWHYAMTETGVTTEWLLRLDGDYVVTEALSKELATLVPPADVGGYVIEFDYAIFGRKLVTSFYPPKEVLFRRGCFEVYAKGHTEAWRVIGASGRLKGRIVHDDWKPVRGWVGSQVNYMARELPHTHEQTGLKAKLRLTPPLMPVVTFLYALFGKGLIFSGRAGIFYALQRLLAETVLALMALEEKLKDGKKD